MPGGLVIVCGSKPNKIGKNSMDNIIGKKITKIEHNDNGGVSIFLEDDVVIVASCESGWSEDGYVGDYVDISIKTIEDIRKEKLDDVMWGIVSGLPKKKVE